MLKTFLEHTMTFGTLLVYILKIMVAFLQYPLVVEKFRDFQPVPGVGATKHHLEELQTEYLNDSLKDILRSAAGEVQGGEGPKALEELITKTSELKKNTSAIRDIDATDLDSAVAYFENVQNKKRLVRLELKQSCQGLTTTYLLELCQVN
jgi:hypothetical protein